jgi:hypothetical protein
MIWSQTKVLGLVLALVLVQGARASVVNTGAGNGAAIPADTAATGSSAAWTTLGAIGIAEGVKTDFHVGTGLTLVLKIPAGFELNTASPPSISVVAGSDITAASIAVTDRQTLTITLTVSGTGTRDTLSIGATGLQVRPAQTAPLASGKHIYRPTSGGGTATITGITNSADGSDGSDFGDLTETPGALARLLLLLPGETSLPGAANGKTGTPLTQTAGTAFSVTVNSADQYWNLTHTSTDVVSLASSDAAATLPANAALLAGTASFSVNLRTAGMGLTVSASDVSRSGIAPGAGSVDIANRPHAGGPVVAIHDSELTRALETLNASAPTPAGSGTTGKEWWVANWHYFVLPESLKEALSSDGLTCEILSDADISAGGLLDTNGRPKYPIFVSLGAEAIGDSEIAQFTNYVAAGGFLFVGSSAFTRNPNGTTRGDFAFANELGVHMVTPGLTNWQPNCTFDKRFDHRLVSHIPGGTPLYWEMPSSAEDSPWGIYPHPGNPTPASLVWQVRAGDATVLAAGDVYPSLLDKQFGRGHFLYYAPLQPLLGNGGWAPGMYAYLIFRNAIQWAFESAKLPLARLSPWPYPYDAALVVRHDLENSQAEISSIESFAQFENSLGAKGDYYFCTGTLRDEMSATYDTNAVIASFRRAISNYGATIGPHNGGLPNPCNPPLATNQYDFWHWGPDEVLDAAPAGFPDGKTYALTSLSNSFRDIEGWLPGQMTNGMRVWVAPYFDATREASLDLQSQLGVKTAGDQKLSPFPHWTISTATSGKRYPFLSLPVSEWFVGNTVAQSMEAGHTITTERALVDFYYGAGALINIYGHHLDPGDIHGDYVSYSMDTNLHPRLWPANAVSLYNWWLQRSNAQITTTSYVTNINQCVTTVSISQAGNPDATVELRLPPGVLSGLQVLTNGVLADASVYRTNGQTVKIRVGTTVTNSQVRFVSGPSAQDDAYAFSSGPVLTVPPPGVLGNDFAGVGGSNLTALLVTGPTNGTLSLSNNGSFTFAPAPGFSGFDSFTYQASDGVAATTVATVTLADSNPVRFSDDFSRGSDPGSLAPWFMRLGSWTVTGGQLLGGTNVLQAYANVYLTNSWADYAVQAQFCLAAGAYGAGLGGRLNPAAGTHYAAWFYPEGSPGGSNVLRLVKFQNWNSWTLLQEVNLAAVGTNSHTVKLAFYQNQIAVFFDGTQRISFADVSGLAYLSGGVSVDMWTDLTAWQLSVSGVSVTPLVADAAYTVNENSILVVGSPGLLGNTTETYGATLSAALVSGPANGTLALNPNGGFTYTPAVNYQGADAFIYQANDGAANLGTAWARITVLSTTRPPPVLTRVRVSDATVVLSWSAVAGGMYRLQYKTNIAGTNWNDLLPDTTATGPMLTVTNALNNSPKTLYRVILLP